MKPAEPQNKLSSAKEFDFTTRDFDRVRDLIYRRAGIALAESKQEMVYSRLARRLRATGMDSFINYLDTLEKQHESDEWEAFVNALTTNLTSFFREAHHFPILAEHVKGRREVSVWCSAASTGCPSGASGSGKRYEHTTSSVSDVAAAPASVAASSG